ncbi:hypothetical protein [Erythrobacter sp. Alg231-14]|uniref:hypothetical protein n=1 Tax=Erythrobacter sp. Alg231-14 TaxID=1922225 RepID=UPI000D55035E
MEVLGGVLLAIAGIVLLAAIGLTTVVALILMAVLGFITEMSFKRLFFVSFGLGLLAPILLGIGVSSVLSDNNIQREIMSELNQSISGPENVIEVIPRISELREQLSDGTITPDQFEEQLEALIEERTGSQIELDGSGVTIDAETEADRLSEVE